MPEVRIVGYTLHLILDNLHHIRLDARVVPFYLLLHDVVALAVLELVDDGYLFVSLGFCRYFLGIYDNAGMENLLFDFLPEIIRHAAHERTLREIGDFGCWNKRIHLRVDGGRGILPVDGERLPLLQDFTETLREILGGFSHDLPAENIAHRILDNLRFLVPIIPR